MCTDVSLIPGFEPVFDSYWESDAYLPMVLLTLPGRTLVAAPASRKNRQRVFLVQQTHLWAIVAVAVRE